MQDTFFVIQATINEFIKMVDKKTIEALVDTAFYNLREDVKTLFGVDLQSDNQIQGQSSLMSWSFLFFKKQFIDSCLNNEKCILHLPEFIFNDSKKILHRFNPIRRVGI